MSRSLIAYAVGVVCLAALGLACGSSASNAASGGINIIARSLRATPTTALRLTLQSSTALSNPLIIPVVVKGDEASTLIKNLPVANDYLVTADALDSSNVVLSHGTVAAVSIVRGQTTQVIIYLNPITVPPPFANFSPLIDTILLSADAVAPGGQIALTATAHDPDPGQTATLAFSWSPDATCGAITAASLRPGTDGDHPSQSRVTWIAPGDERVCRIALTVRDALGLSTATSFIVRVGNVQATGSATVSVRFDRPPEIIAIISTPPQLSKDGVTSGVLEVIATDPENDFLGFAWSSDPASPCSVEFTTPTQPSTRFTATPTQADASYCTFFVTVNDGVWPDTGFIKNTLTSGLILAIAAPLVAQFAPAFSIAYQSHDIATGGTTVWFGATASDPEQGTISYDWSASLGWAPKATDPRSIGLDPAFTTAAVWTVPDGAENMTSAIVVTVTATSSASNLQSATSFILKPANLP